MSHHLRVVLYREEAGWLRRGGRIRAACLERGLGAEGGSCREASEAFRAALRFVVGENFRGGREPLAGLLQRRPAELTELLVRFYRGLALAKAPLIDLPGEAQDVIVDEVRIDL